LTRIGNPDLAERVWESTIQLDAPAPWTGLGHAQLAGGFLAEAAKSFGRAAQMGDPTADLHRAEALVAGGDFAGAAAACDAYLASHPRDLRGVLMKASFLARAGFEEEATKVLRSAADLHPEVPELGRTLGLALLRSGHHAAAADALHESLRRDSHDSKAAAARGAALLVAGRTREAIGVLREALELNPEQADALNNLGVAYLAMGETKPAAVNLERAAKHFESPRILLNLGKVLEAENQRSEAAGAYDQVLRLRPKDSEGRAGRKRLAPASKSKRRPRKKSPTSSKKTTPSKKRQSKAPAEEPSPT
jgi:tetratricopeptide (TPR) repeat protein